MLIRSAFAALALLALAACGHDDAPPPAPAAAAPDDAEGAAPAPIPMDASAGPSGGDAMTWIFDRQGREGRTRLMYSARANDEMALNLQCDSEGVHVLILRMAPMEDMPTTWPFTLQSGSVRTHLVGAIDRAEDGLLTISALAPLNDAVFTAARESGLLSIQDSAGAQPMNAIDDEERQSIAAFFAACA